ncbi:MAG: universal stress protein [Chloroflexi bacterium]|nr:universal stress protein [Chloroflexota bacterium]MCZ6790078.1 universal stress protein [Chloroflexota bacterium]
MEAKRVLLPVHGDELDQDSLQLACKLVKESKGKIYVLYVIEVDRRLPLDADISSEDAKAEQVIRQMEELGKKYKVEIEGYQISARDAGPAVVQEAVEREVDAIVVGLHHKRRYGAFSLGKTVPFILKHSPCPVLLLRGKNGATPS